MLVTKCHLCCGNLNIQILVPVEASNVLLIYKIKKFLYIYINVCMCISALQFQREAKEFLVLLLRPRTPRLHSPVMRRGHLRLLLAMAHGAPWQRAPRLMWTWLWSPAPAPCHPPRHGLEQDTSRLAVRGTRRSPFHPGSPPTSQLLVNLLVSFSELQDGI